MRFDECEFCQMFDAQGNPMGSYRVVSPRLRLKAEQIAAEDVPELLDPAEDVWAMRDNQALTPWVRAAWTTHYNVLKETVAGGWMNPVHPWTQKTYTRYAIAFAAYSIPSVAMCDPSEYELCKEGLVNSLRLLKMYDIWSDWITDRWGSDPVSSANIMYKGHIALIEGLYTMMTGESTFEAEFKGLVSLIANEMRTNGRDRGFPLVECEPDQVFFPCNSISLLAFRIHDKLYGTDLESELIEPSVAWLEEHMCDPETKMTFFRWHPSNGAPEAFMFGDWWALNTMRIFDPDFFGAAYQSAKDLFIVDLADGKMCYPKASLIGEGISTDGEQSNWKYMLCLCAREHNDIETWSKAMRFLVASFDLHIEDNGEMRFGDVTDYESVYQTWIFAALAHQGWENVIDFDWAALRGAQA